MGREQRSAGPRTERVAHALPSPSLSGSCCFLADLCLALLLGAVPFSAPSCPSCSFACCLFFVSDGACACFSLSLFSARIAELSPFRALLLSSRTQRGSPGRLLAPRGPRAPPPARAPSCRFRLSGSSTRKANALADRRAPEQPRQAQPRGPRAARRMRSAPAPPGRATPRPPLGSAAGPARPPPRAAPPHGPLHAGPEPACTRSRQRSDGRQSAGRAAGRQPASQRQRDARRSSARAGQREAAPPSPVAAAAPQPEPRCEGAGRRGWRGRVRTALGAPRSEANANGSGGAKQRAGGPGSLALAAGARSRRRRPTRADGGAGEGRAAERRLRPRALQLDDSLSRELACGRRCGNQARRISFIEGQAERARGKGPGIRTMADTPNEATAKRMCRQRSKEI